jgi:hypothetical protein
MPKYGKGLNYEIALAVQKGEINQPFNVNDVKKYTQSQNWLVPISYLNVCLANGSSENHSQTYKKYFENVGDGKYILKKE